MNEAEGAGAGERVVVYHLQANVDYMWPPLGEPVEGRLPNTQKMNVKSPKAA